MKERRKANRIKVSLQAMWEGSLATLNGEITDLSVKGCFILTDDKVTVGELIRLKIQLPQSGQLDLSAKVIYQMPEIGFGIYFTGGNESEMKRLGWLVKAELRRFREY